MSEIYSLHVVFECLMLCTGTCTSYDSYGFHKFEVSHAFSNSV